MTGRAGDTLTHCSSSYRCILCMSELLWHSRLSDHLSRPQQRQLRQPLCFAPERSNLQQGYRQSHCWAKSRDALGVCSLSSYRTLVTPSQPRVAAAEGADSSDSEGRTRYTTAAHCRRLSTSSNCLSHSHQPWHHQAPLRSTPSQLSPLPRTCQTSTVKTSTATAS